MGLFPTFVCLRIPVCPSRLWDHCFVGQQSGKHCPGGMVSGRKVLSRSPEGGVVVVCSVLKAVDSGGPGSLGWETEPCY